MEARIEHTRLRERNRVSNGDKKEEISREWNGDLIY